MIGRSNLGGIASPTTSKLPSFLQSNSPLKTAGIEGVVVVGLVLIAGLSTSAANAILALMGLVVIFTALNAIGG